MKEYLLAMFPFTSGKLHMGHYRLYLIQDILSKHFKKYNTPFMGFDSHGLPTENASNRLNIKPRLYTEKCIKDMKNDFKMFKFDYCDDTVVTSDETFYKWTQYIFIKMFEAGLVYKKKDYVNWDPVDKTVLANEQVINGRGERSGAAVEQMLLDQWFIKVKHYEKDLLDGLDELDWPEKVKQQQRNWIGRMHGQLVQFKYKNNHDEYTVDCFVKNIKSKFVPMIALIHKLHPLYNVLKLDLFHSRKVNYGGSIYEFSGLYFSNGSVKIPLFISNSIQSDQVFILTDDNIHDLKIANYLKDCFYLEILQNNNIIMEKSSNNIVMKDSSNNNIMKDSSNNNIMKDSSNSIVMEKSRAKTLYRLKDWVVSRQRKWGTPIPFVTCKVHGQVPLPYNELPLKHDTKYRPCPKCRVQSQTSNETMDTFFDSSFYFHRFLDPNNTKELVSLEKSKSVNLYIGGIEHSVLHLLYARFVNFFLYESGLVNEKEPFKTFLANGMVLGKSFKVDGKYIHPDMIVKTPNGIFDQNGNPVETLLEKMSKSKLNGCDPIKIIEKYGTDCTRLYVSYKADFKDELIWEDDGIKGMTRFLYRLNLIQQEFKKQFDSDEIKKIDFEVVDTKLKKIITKVVLF
jgi:leucyl-tRNA synthetase